MAEAFSSLNLQQVTMTRRTTISLSLSFLIWNAERIISVLKGCFKERRKPRRTPDQESTEKPYSAPGGMFCPAQLGADGDHLQEEGTGQVARSKNGTWSEAMQRSPYSFPIPSPSPPAFLSIKMALKHNMIRKSSFCYVLSDE